MEYPKLNKKIEKIASEEPEWEFCAMLDARYFVHEHLRYQALKRMTPLAFCEIIQECRKNKLNFDDVVDEHIEMNLKDANESKNVEIEHRAWVDAKNANMAERFPVVLSAENEKINITSETLELMTKSIKIINGSPSNFEVLNEK